MFSTISYPFLTRILYFFTMVKSEKKNNIIFCCQSCGYQTSKWLGKCPDCGKWDTLIEETRSSLSIHPATYSGKKHLSKLHAQPVPIDSIAIAKNEHQPGSRINHADYAYCKKDRYTGISHRSCN